MRYLTLACVRLSVGGAFFDVNQSKCSYLEVEMLHVPGLWYGSTPLEQIPHTVPSKESRAREEVVDFSLVQTQRSVHLVHKSNRMQPDVSIDKPHVWLMKVLLNK